MMKWKINVRNVRWNFFFSLQYIPAIGEQLEDEQKKKIWRSCIFSWKKYNRNKTVSRAVALNHMVALVYLWHKIVSNKLICNSQTFITVHGVAHIHRDARANYWCKAYTYFPVSGVYSPLESMLLSTNVPLFMLMGKVLPQIRLRNLIGHFKDLILNSTLCIIIWFMVGKKHRPLLYSGTIEILFLARELIIVFQALFI